MCKRTQYYIYLQYCVGSYFYIEYKEAESCTSSVVFSRKEEALNVGNAVRGGFSTREGLDITYIYGTVLL